MHVNYSAATINKYKKKAFANNHFQFMDDILLLMLKGVDFNSYDIHLNGGRKSRKTYQATEFVAKAVLAIAGECDAYLFRWLNKDSAYLFEEIQERMECIMQDRQALERFINYSNKTIKINNNIIYTMGLHTSNKRKRIELTGLKRAVNKKYAIIILEECYEFTDAEILAIKHAIGGYKNIITIYISNPNTLDTPYLKRLNSMFPHDIAKLSTDGYQFKQLNNILILYNNWRVNPYLSSADIETISQTWEIDPERAKVVDYGIPGIEAGLIYSAELPYVIRFKMEKAPVIDRISVGIDWGDGSTEEGSATAAVIVGRTSKNADVIFKEYYHHNKNFYLSTTERAKNIIQMISDFFKLPRYRHFTNYGVDVILDTGLYSEREQLEIEAANRHITWLNFKFALKNQERSRINIRKYKMSTGRYYVEENITEHMREMAVQKWDESRKDKQGQPKQEDAENHTTDAEDYAISYDLHDVADEDIFKLLYK